MFPNKNYGKTLPCLLSYSAVTRNDDCNRKICEIICDSLRGWLDLPQPYLFLDGIYLKRSWGGEVQNVSVLVAVGVNADGYREMLGVAEGRAGGQGVVEQLSEKLERK